MKDQNIRGKRGDNQYRQVSGYVEKNKAIKFKSACALLEIDQSEALEQMIAQWLSENKDIFTDA